MNKYRGNNCVRKNETGIVAIFVTLIMMIVISIIVIGFSQIARREVADAVNRQLSTEAFYAAESGVNDAYSVIYQNITSRTPNPNILANLANCQSSTYINGSSNFLNSPTDTTGYTCLLVNNTPTSQTQTAATGQPVVFPLNSPTPFNTITFIWSPNTGDAAYNASNCPGAPKFPPAASWSTCPPIVRADLVPIPNSPTPFSQASLEAAQKILFLYPQAIGQNNHSTSSLDYSSITNGEINPLACTSTCTFTINGLDCAGCLNLDNYYLNLQYIYGNGPSYSVSGTNASGAVEFQNDVAQIDSTGEAQNVLRRIQVEVSLNSESSDTYSIPSPPSYAIQTNSSLCKSLIIDVANGNTVYEDIQSGAPAGIVGSAGVYPAPVAFDIDAPAHAVKASDPCSPYIAPGS